MDWTEEASLRLIECYRQKDLLWNTRNPDHFTKSQRNIAWEEIGEDMVISADECKKKMSILLASMRRLKSKIRKSLEAGTGETLRCTWFAFKSLLFMWPKYLQRNVSISEPQDEPRDPLLATDSQEDVDPLKIEEPHPEPSHTAPSTSWRKRKRRLKPSTIERRVVAKPTLSRRDSFTIFGEFVEDSVRNLQNNRLQSWARHQINNVLYMAEQASFQNSSDDLPANLFNFNPNQLFTTVNPVDLLASNSRNWNPSSPRPSDSSKNVGIFFKEEPPYSDPPSPN